MICYLWSTSGAERRGALRDFVLKALRRAAAGPDSGTDDDTPGGHRDPESKGLIRIPVRTRDDEVRRDPEE